MACFACGARTSGRSAARARRGGQSANLGVLQTRLASAISPECSALYHTRLGLVECKAS